MHHVTAALAKALREGRNTVAVHTHQTTGGQHIDLALLCQ
jgi:acetyl-CoA carboxylase beta subunit